MGGAALVPFLRWGWTNGRAAKIRNVHSPSVVFFFVLVVCGMFGRFFFQSASSGKIRKQTCGFPMSLSQKCLGWRSGLSSV